MAGLRSHLIGSDGVLVSDGVRRSLDDFVVSSSSGMLRVRSERYGLKGVGPTPWSSAPLPRWKAQWPSERRSVRPSRNAHLN